MLALRHFRYANILAHAQGDRALLPDIALRRTSRRDVLNTPRRHFFTARDRLRGDMPLRYLQISRMIFPAWHILASATAAASGEGARDCHEFGHMAALFAIFL